MKSARARLAGLLLCLALLLSVMAVPAIGQQPTGIVKSIRVAANIQSEPFVTVGDHLVVLAPGPALTVFDLVTLEQTGSVPLKTVPYRLLVRAAAVVDGVHAGHKTLLPLDDFARTPNDAFEVEEFVRSEYTGPFRPTPGRYAFVWQKRLFGFPSSGEIAICSGTSEQRIAYDTALADEHGMYGYRISLVGKEPVGFTARSVLSLDRNLTPTGRLLELGSMPGAIDAAVTDGKTLGIVRGHPAQNTSLEVWARFGAKPLARVGDLQGAVSGTLDRCLIPFAGGYLCASKPFAWVHPDGRIWQTTPRDESASYVSHPARIALSNHRIIMSSRGGDVHIIDPAAVLGRPIPPPSYEGGPKPVLPGITPVRGQ